MHGVNCELGRPALRLASCPQQHMQRIVHRVRNEQLAIERGVGVDLAGKEVCYRMLQGFVALADPPEIRRLRHELGQVTQEGPAVPTGDEDLEEGVDICL